MPASTLVTSKPACPLCVSNARREIDLLIHARHFANTDSAPTEIISSETGEIVEVEGHNDSYEQTFAELNLLLSKLPAQNTGTFDLTDVIIHATNHRIVTEIRNQEIRSEGKFLFVGDSAFQSPDLKDYLRLIIAEGARQLATGEVKVQPKMGIEAAIALWRMTGNAGSDDFTDVMRDMVQKGHIGKESPLGKAFAERQAVLAAKSSAVDDPEPPVPPAPSTVTDAEIQPG